MLFFSFELVVVEEQKEDRHINIRIVSDEVKEDNLIIHQDKDIFTQEEVEIRFKSREHVKVEEESVSLASGKNNELAAQARKKLSLEDFRVEDSPENIKSGIEKPRDFSKSERHDFSDGEFVDWSGDFEKDKKIAKETNLNSSQYKYYSFYHRIRQQVEQNWISLLTNEYKNQISIDRGGILETILVLKMDKNGNIIEVLLTTPSGSYPADTLAKSVFSVLKNFPNPPVQMFNEKEFVYIKYGFILHNIY